MPAPVALNAEFDQFTRVYVKSFVKSYWRYGPQHGADVQLVIPFLRLYAQTIKENAAEIGKAAEQGISEYLNRYNVSTEESADEYKIIYYLGRAIHRFLPAPVLKGVHLFTMIGLLDYRLRTLGVRKPVLTKALTSLVRTGEFDAELGATGGYLIYKCVSTTVRKPECIAEPANGERFHGLDRPAVTLTESVLGTTE